LLRNFPPASKRPIEAGCNNEVSLKKRAAKITVSCQTPVATIQRASTQNKKIKPLVNGKDLFGSLAFFVEPV
jgi:hypothetical protein